MAGLNRQPLGSATGEDGPLIEVAGGAGAVAWLVAVIGWWLAQPEGQGPGLAMVILLVAAPLALIFGLVSTLRALRQVRAETVRLQAALQAARSEPRPASRPEPAARAAAPRSPEPARAAAPAEQPRLDLEEAPDAPPLTIEDYLRALNFPDSSEDAEGIEALHRVLTDHEAARLIRSAQDVLTLLAEDGVFMDNLVPEPARPDLWRRFAMGERGEGTFGVGAVRDRAALVAAAARMREDQIFRDAAHHFMRTFDRSLPAFGEYATDGELVALADTRTSRAFMLLARASGAFD